MNLGFFLDDFYEMMTPRVVAVVPDKSARVLELVTEIQNWANVEGVPIYRTGGPWTRTSQVDLAVARLARDDRSLLLIAPLSAHEPFIYQRLRSLLDRELPAVLVVLLDSMKGLQSRFGANFQTEQWKRLQAAGATLLDPGAEAQTPAESANEVQQALERINEHRRQIGQRPLDPAAAGWSDEDVLLEAERIVRLPNPRRARLLRRRLLT